MYNIIEDINLRFKIIFLAEIQMKGMVLPFSSDIYRPILQRLKTEGFEARERSVIKKWTKSTNISV